MHAGVVRIRCRLCSLSVMVAWLAVGGRCSARSRWARLDPRWIPEASGIVKSRRHPGIFWVHNDSGNPPLLFAIRGDGRIVRQFRLEIPNIDWEDIAIDDQGHLYLGDIGNNLGELPIRAIYRIDEPDPAVPHDKPLGRVVSDLLRLPAAETGSTPRA